MVLELSNTLYNIGFGLEGIRLFFFQLQQYFWNFLPRLVLFFVILLVGYVIAKIIASLSRTILEKIGFEKAMEKIKIGKHFESIGFKNTSHFLSIFVFWSIFLIFLQAAIRYLQTTIVSNILHTITLFIVKALIASLLVVIGLYVGTLVADIVKKALEKTGLQKKTQVIDKHIAGTGYTFFSLLGLIIKIWVFLIFVGLAVEVLAIRILSQLVEPIILYFPNVIVAFFVVIAGLFIADYIVKAIENWLEKTPFGKQLKKADKSTEKSGFSILNIALMLIKAWILLIFVQIALDLMAIPVLRTVLNPIISFFPRLLIAMLLIIIGFLVVDVVLKIVHKLLNELGANKFIEPVDDMLKKPGLVMRFINFLISVTVMLIFINMAIAVLNITQLTSLVNTVILYMPNLFAAAFIILIGLWFAGWLSERILAMSKKNEIPFPSLIANAIKFIVIFIVITMALAQVRIEVPILYIAFAIAFGAVMIGLGAGFAYGVKDISANMGGYIQVTEMIKQGDSIKVGEYSGKVEKVTRYSTLIKDGSGKHHAIPNTYLVKNTVTKN